MTIEPRDEYDNLCIFGPGDQPTDGYNVNITQVEEFRGEIYVALKIYLILGEENLYAVPLKKKNSSFLSLFPQIGSVADQASMVDCSIQLDYDSPNQRIRLKVSFPKGGCYHATVSLAGLQLHNGDFDIIVLESTWRDRFVFPLLRRYSTKPVHLTRLSSPHVTFFRLCGENGA